ncbi:MAG: glycolate oxidase iron-sulfur subunit [Alphaproteobacteria bacterium]|nr:glycolate oxidase iron-sulfur subunit [Alphaproteobacteria bacterium]|tara:strand:+ start:483 stop:1775 length:1293 start_codon:yes stop_codon:yes gene_type:complete
MQTNFTLAQLADPDIAVANDILRACVHCGFCTATCPTYVLLGDELDSPRGRIYLMKQMLEADAPADEEVVRHVDRCLSCLSCMTTCPSGVHYQHLVDHGRKHIEETYTRPAFERMIRWALAWSIPYPRRFRMVLAAALLARPLRGLLRGRLRAMLDLAPTDLGPPSPVDVPQVFPAEGTRKGRIALLNGCAQTVIAPQINEATIRLLTRLGVEVVVAQGAGCCGSLVHHMGMADESHAQAAANIDAWIAEADGGGLDAIIINTSGCGTQVKDYGFMFREDVAYADKAARVSALAKDISEYLTALDPDLTPAGDLPEMRVTYHSACSMQHGQQIRTPPKALLTAAGYTVSEPGEGHLCCGSAGTYNILQPELATQLRDRKAANIARTAPDVVATGNVGCITQLAAGVDVPVVHMVELLDWATGGPRPRKLG